MGVARVLLLADTHLGFDLPLRPRVARRRRGHDFFANFERALRPALDGRVDAVVHGGDLLYRSRVPARLVDMAFAPLRRVADAGVPVFVVPGNHERSRIPHPLLAAHPGIRVFNGPRTFAVDAGGVRVAFAGFPYARGVRARFRELVGATGYRDAPADVRVLCMHHCFEGARCGPGDFTFRCADDVVRAADVPDDVAAVLSGHIHRHQVLARDLRGRALAAPVLYPGSVERTSFAERDEPKGSIRLELAPGGAGGRLLGWRFDELPARPMLVREIDAAGADAAQLERQVRDALRGAPADAVVQLRVRGRLAGAAAGALAAARLRAIAPPTMNLTVALPRGAGGQQSSAPRARSRARG